MATQQILFDYLPLILSPQKKKTRIKGNKRLLRRKCNKGNFIYGMDFDRGLKRLLDIREVGMGT
jgi:hypothetical protein